MDGSDASIGGLASAGQIDLSGAWHLSDCYMTYRDGKVQRPWGSSASGYLIYAPDGHMCKSLNYPKRDGTIACVSYCGQYEVAEGRVRHFIEVSADISDVGTLEEQSIALEHDRLTLSGTPAPAGGPGSVIFYVWLRAGSGARNASSTPRAFAGKSFNLGL